MTVQVQVQVPGGWAVEVFAVAGSVAEPELATTFPAASVQVTVEFVAPGTTDVALAEMLVSGVSLNDLVAPKMRRPARRLRELPRVLAVGPQHRRCPSTDPSLVRYVQLVAKRRLPGTWALNSSLSVGLIPVLLWSTLVVSPISNRHCHVLVERSNLLTVIASTGPGRNRHNRQSLRAAGGAKITALLAFTPCSTSLAARSGGYRARMPLMCMRNGIGSRRSPLGVMGSPCCSLLSRIGVSTTPGMTTLTRIPLPAASARRPRLRPTTPNLAVA